jgi:hypothetical protein
LTSETQVRYLWYICRSVFQCVRFQTKEEIAEEARAGLETNGAHRLLRDTGMGDRLQEDPMIPMAFLWYLLGFYSTKPARASHTGKLAATAEGVFRLSFQHKEVSQALLVRFRFILLSSLPTLPSYKYNIVFITTMYIYTLIMSDPLPIPFIYSYINIYLYIYAIICISVSVTRAPSQVMRY